MKSIIARLEALEAQSQQSLVLLVAFKDGSAKEMSVAEFKELAQEHYSDLDSTHIVSGDNPKELEEKTALCTLASVGAVFLSGKAYSVF